MCEISQKLGSREYGYFGAQAKIDGPTMVSFSFNVVLFVVVTEFIPLHTAFLGRYMYLFPNTVTSTNYRLIPAKRA
jgi:hypothetical protein